MDLLHMDFTSIVTTTELNRPPKVANVLVFQDHIMKHVIAYVTPDQTAKTVAKFLYQGYILIFGAPTRLLSGWGSNFMSSSMIEMCKVLGVKKLWTMPFHPQTNGLVERSHQTIMRMIGKLREDKKANWPGHLAEIVHTYNATQSAMTGYSSHYLMFGWRPRVPVDFYFPTFRSTEAPMRGTSTKWVDKYMATVHDWLRATLWEAQAQSMAKAQQQKWYYNQKLGTMDLKPGNLVLVKDDAFKGKGQIKDRWEDEPCEVVHQIATDIPSYKVMDQCRQSCILHCNRLLLIASETGVSLCMIVHQAWNRCNSPTPVNPTPRGSDSEDMPQENSGLATTQCQARNISLWWINGKLQILLWTSARVSTDDWWRLQVMCSRHGCLPDHMHLAEGLTLLPADAIR